MSFMFLVVVPIGLTAGVVSWTLFRRGGLGGVLFSVLLGLLGAVVGSFAGSALAATPSALASGIGAAIGALFATGLETIVRWRTPRSMHDATAQGGASAPIDDPKLNDMRGAQGGSRLRGSEI